MKNLKLAIILLALSMLQFSCKKDKEEEPSTQTLTEVSVTEGKSLIEDSAVDMINKADNFRTDAAVVGMHELSDYLDQNMITTRIEGTPQIFNYFLSLGEAVSSGKIDVKDLSTRQIKTMRSGGLYQDYNEETGIFVWNAGEGDFIKTGESSDINYSINYMVNGVAKSASFIVSNFSIKTIDMEEIVKSVNVSFKIDAVEYLGFSLASAYSNYLPTSINATLIFGALSAELSFDNSSNTSLNAEGKIKLDNSVLFKNKYAATGNFTTIDNGEEVTEENSESIFNSASTELTILSLVLSADMNLQPVAAYINANPEADIDAVVAKLNENSTILLKTTNNQKIADGEFYAATYEYSDFEYNENTGEYMEVTYSEQEMDIRFVFEDGTRSDFETYFGEGFQTMEDQFNSMYDSYESMLPENM